MEANYWPNDPWIQRFPMFLMVLRVGNRKQPLESMEWRRFSKGSQMVWPLLKQLLVTNHRSGLPRKVVKLVTHLKTPEQDILDHLNLYCIDIMDLLAAIINRAVICEERYAAQEQYIWPCLVIRTLVSCHQIMRRSQRFE